MKAVFKSVASVALVGCGLALINGCAGPRETLPLPPNAMASVEKTDSQMRAVLDKLHEMNPKPIAGLTADEARKQPTIADAAKKVRADNHMSTDPEPVGGISSSSAPVSGTDISLRIYTPAGAQGPYPTLIYFHGGGWVIGTLDAYDASCRALTNLAHCQVISVDYRQAPEYKFPVPTEDAYAVTQYVMAHPDKYNVDKTHVTVGGESAGGNLAAVVCMMARDRGGMMPIYQLLIYPVTDYKFDSESYEQNAYAVPLNRESMKWFFDKYLNIPGEGMNQYVSIVRGDAGKTPAATVITADIDPLRSDGQAYADKLRMAGIPVKYQNYPGVTHEFFGLGQVSDTARRAERFAAEGLQSAFAQ